RVVVAEAAADARRWRRQRLAARRPGRGRWRDLDRASRRRPRAAPARVSPALEPEQDPMTETRARPPAPRAAAAPALRLLVLAGFSFRVCLAVWHVWPSFDGVYYLTAARDLVCSGHVPFETFPPGWPFVIAIPLAFLRHDDPAAALRAAQTANVVLGTLVPLLGFVAVRRRLGSRWARGAPSV